ncbi:MAG: SLBB domain-containing protein [Bacteroidota bacterium]|nr:SLBB domain-containing protein [Bacteroidota bacterium]
MSHRRKHLSIYRLRKFLFWLISCLLLFGIISFIWIFPVSKDNEEESSKSHLTVGICGPVRKPGIYKLPEGSDLSQLILEAGGLRNTADIRTIDLNLILKNDSVYLIPLREKIRDSVPSLPSVDLSQIQSKSPAMPVPINIPEIKSINIFYVEFPSIFMLVTYYPDQKRVSIVNIPHSSVFLYDNNRLVDFFFTMGVNVTKNLLERVLHRRIDYYLIQDRMSFIETINKIGGINIPADKYFAEAYHLTASTRHLDGFQTWDYMRFVDMKRVNSNFNMADNNQTQAATNLSLARQREAVSRLSKFNGRRFSATEMKAISQDPHLASKTLKEYQSKAASMAINGDVLISGRDQELAYGLRNNRLHIVVKAMREAFLQLPAVDKISVVQSTMNSFQTNLGKELLFRMYKDLLSSNDFSFATIPGTYSDEGRNLYFYPNISNFINLKNEELRNMVKIYQKPGNQKLY